MIFRRKLLALFALTICLSVAAVAGLVLAVTRTAFEKSEEQQTAALVAQFQREFARQGNEIVHQVEAIAGSETVERLAGSLNTGAESYGSLDLARTVAENHQLDFLEFVDERGTIISSAQWAAKFGYPETAFASLASASQGSAFLKQEEMSDSASLGLFAVRSARVGEHSIYVIGGKRIDKNFLSALDLPAGTRALLYQNRGDRFSPELLVEPAVSSDSNAQAYPAQKFAVLIDAVRQSNQENAGIIRWSSDRADDEVFHAIPLRGVGGEHSPPLAILLIGSARRPYVELKRHITASALLVGGGGIVLAILLSSWAAARVTRPVEKLAHAAQEVAAGNWTAHVDLAGDDELAQLAASFNRMTSELLTQKERLVQAERVAAWRELARRLAHELKNPLFPLQLTVENLVRARAQSPEQFDEVFRESSRTLLAEISNLKAIVGRFSEFSKMPQPQLQTVQINEILRGVAQLFEAQLSAPGRPAIHCRLALDQDLAPIAADSELLHRAISNLVLNAMDAMPNGGTLTLRSRREDGNVVIEVADTGAGLTKEECERIFTPYYTSKQHGTGLGLAIVQSVVSDHRGRISVNSEPGGGTTFTIELPGRAAENSAKA
jgi:two-component system, NtrC family, nitrogen regulation sensor histidine kinase NtrY